MGRKLTNENAFLRLLSEEIGPLYWIGSDRVIRYANETLASWLGLKRDEIEGLTAEYLSTPSGSIARDAVNSLCPPHSAFDGAESFSMTIQRGGAAVLVVGKSQRLWSPDGVDLGLLVMVTGETPVRRPKLATEELHLSVAKIRDEHRFRYRIERFLGVSDAATRMRDSITAAMESEASTLIIGPPGSGRETIARTIHAAGGVVKKLLPILCRDLDAEMLRSLIDTSAYQKRSDVADQALLLLEVDLLDAAGQETLRTMFRSAVYPRVFSTARRSLKNLAELGRFDLELGEKLGEILVESAPLAQRREDIPILAQAFLEELNLGRETQLNGFSFEAMELLVCYSWPENIDQLNEVVRTAVSKARSAVIGANDLPERIRAARHAAQHPRDGAPEAIQIEKVLEQVERELIERALAIAGGNKSKAAQLLSLPRNRLLRRMEHLKLTSARAKEEAEELPDFRPLSDFAELDDSVEVE